MKKEKHFYRYTEKEADYKRLNLLFGTVAVLILPVFVFFAFFSTLPNIYADITLLSSIYILCTIGITQLFKNLRKYIFPIYFVLFCGITLYVWGDLIKSDFETNHMVGFIFLYSVIIIAIQRFYYAVIYNILAFVIIVISYLIIQGFKDDFIILSALVFIAGSISVLVLHSRNKMVKRIQDYSSYLSEIINQPGIGVALLSGESPNRILDYNNCFLRLLGSEQEKIPKNIDIIISNVLGEKLSDLKESRFDYEIKKHNQWVEIFVDKIILNEGEFYLLKIVDITESKKQSIQSERNETKFRLLFEEGNDAIFLTKEGIIQNANHNTEKLLGIPIEKIIGSTLWDYSSPNLDFNFLKEKIESINDEKNRKVIEWDILRSDGTIINVEIVILLMNAHGERIEQCVVRDITEQKNYESKLKNTQQSFKSIIENIPEAILLFVNNTIIFANSEAYRMLNFSEKSQFSIELDDLFRGENKDIFIKAKNSHGEHKKLINDQVEVCRFNSEEKLEVEFTLTPTLYNGEKVSMLILKDISLINKLAGERSRLGVAEKMNEQLMHEITERRRTEKLLQEQSLKLSAIIENSSNTLIWTVDEKFRLLMYNGYFYKTVQQLFKKELVIGMNMLNFFSDKMDKAGSENSLRSLFKVLSGDSNQIESRLKIYDKTYWFETFLNPIFDTEGRVIEVSCVSHNITDKKEGEQELRSSLREKEILLKEVHHRVKNNLQVISSILNLQSSYVSDESTKTILKESQNRIKSMSFIHENLYQTDKFSSLDFSEYIFNLSNNLVHSYQIFDNLVEIKYNMDQVNLSLDQAIPCGLIVNELVSNALKYAFPDRTKGELLIQLKKRKNKIELVIGDNGIGLPKDLDIKNTDTLGLQLVLTLVDQLDAVVDVQREDGTKYLITFELLKA